MRPSSSSTSCPSATDIAGGGAQDVQMENNGGQEETSLAILGKGGGEVFIRIDPKTMLCSVLAALDNKTEPIFTEIDCGRHGVRFAIKVKASALTVEADDATRYSIFLGEPSNNISNATNSAVLRVFQDMDEKHHIKIRDFSSRLVEKYERNYTRSALSDAMFWLEKIIFEWEMTIEKCEELTVSLLGKEMNEVHLGTLTHIGEVFGTAVNPLRSILVELHGKKEEAKKEMEDVQEQRARIGDKLIKMEENKLSREGHREVELQTKHVLDYVLKFLGLEKAMYMNEPGCDGMVHTSVHFFIPHMDIYKHGGNIKLSAKGESSQDSEDKAAFEALQFIENNFRIKIADYNYQDRKKATKYEERLVEMLTKILEVADEVKFMWGSLNNVIQCQKNVLKLDPTTLFTGTSAQGQVRAFTISSEIVDEVMNCSTAAYKGCLDNFQKLDKLKWVIIKNKNGLPC